MWLWACFRLRTAVRGGRRGWWTSWCKKASGQTSKEIKGREGGEVGRVDAHRQRVHSKETRQDKTRQDNALRASVKIPIHIESDDPLMASAPLQGFRGMPTPRQPSWRGSFCLAQACFDDDNVSLKVLCAARNLTMEYSKTLTCTSHFHHTPIAGTLQSSTAASATRDVI